MSLVTYTTWARLEPSVSDPSLDPGVRAEVADPLWALARQWQLGEFLGEDVGTPVGIEVHGGHSPVDRVRVGPSGAGAAARTFDYDPAAAPLDPVVAGERGPDPEAAVALTLQAAARFVAELAARGGDAATLDDARDAHPLDVSAVLAECAPASRRRLGIMAPRLFDGLAFARSAAAEMAAGTWARGSRATDAATAVIEWLRTEIDLDAAPPAEVAPPGWQSGRLDLTFAIGAKRPDGGEVVLRAPSLTGGGIDWWSLDRSGESSLGARTATQPLTPDGPLIVLPTRLGFRGAPTSRYWELEDAAVDLGAATAAPHETARMLTLGFAFVYGGDWVGVPIELPVGSRCTIAAVVVTDSFGDRVLVDPASALGTAGNPGTRLWRVAGEDDDATMVMPRLGPVLAGSPVELLTLLRDEQANLAWAVESVARDGAGVPTDWRAVAPPPPSPPASNPQPPPADLTLLYRLASDVPQHWFPLVPEARGDRLARYRVGLLPDGRDALPHPPRSLLLRELAAAAAGLDEVELPSEGRTLERRPYAARWSDGSLHVWTARDAGPGRGEGGSGLRFDIIEGT